MAYNDLITIQQSSTGTDDYGGDQFTWSTYKEVWAEVVDTGGSMSYESDQPVWRDSKTFRIRTYDAPNVKAFPQMRIMHTDQNTEVADYFMITGIEKEGRLFTTLTGEAVDDD